jgi:hypothetical protein
MQFCLKHHHHSVAATPQQLQERTCLVVPQILTALAEVHLKRDNAAGFGGTSIVVKPSNSRCRILVCREVDTMAQPITVTGHYAVFQD